MKIAIAGAGFAGLSVAWHLAFHATKHHQITVFDPHSFPGGASSTAAGLVHPFSGKRGNLAKWGEEAFQAALNLFEEAKKYQSQDFVLHRGMLRLAMTKEQELDYKNSALTHSHLRWFEKEECRQHFPLLSPLPGLFVEKALAIDPQLYLEALKLGLKAKRVSFVDKSISDKEDLHSFDAAVIACGYKTCELTHGFDIPFRFLKGQGFEFALPNGVLPFKYAINGDLYAVMLRDQKRLFVGATFERGNADPAADLEVAKEKIYPKLKAMIPSLAEQEPLAIRSHVRLTTASHMPYVHRLEKNTWVFSGLGSKGLLYHAFLGKRLAGEIDSL
ncbi:NAD(P)/FAD-dependent oxidoreductase [Estrella lausannensis]|uniref:Oxidoreductase n=1 Tax=Estrella lausannensis TaxID=483423 RepID=A0A0H5E501_9BACT|nr:FAD-dependent oxidoreductase [Estrella lausannensis]CRX38320.1 Oxidoreductase [Estrella lausannensis]